LSDTDDADGEPLDGTSGDEVEDGSTGDDRPEIEDDERAEVDLGGVDPAEIEAAVSGPTDDPTSEGGESEDEDGEDDPHGEEADTHAERGHDGGSSESSASTTWGDQYVSLLAVILGAVVDEHGEGDPVEVRAEVEALATQAPLRLDEDVDRLVAEMGGTEDLPPGQAIAVGSGVVAVSVLAKDSAVLSSALENVRDGAGGGTL
jgi:hypothetical protein